MQRLTLRILYWALASLARRRAYDLIDKTQRPTVRPRCWAIVVRDEHGAGRPCIRTPLHPGDHHAEPMSHNARLFEETVKDLRAAYVALLEVERYADAVTLLDGVEAAVPRCHTCGGVEWWVWNETTKSYLCGVCT